MSCNEHRKMAWITSLKHCFLKFPSTNILLFPKASAAEVQEQMWNQVDCSHDFSKLYQIVFLKINFSKIFFIFSSLKRLLKNLEWEYFSLAVLFKSFTVFKCQIPGILEGYFHCNFCPILPLRGAGPQIPSCTPKHRQEKILAVSPFSLCCRGGDL